MTNEGETVTHTCHHVSPVKGDTFRPIREEGDTCDTFSWHRKTGRVTGDTFSVVRPTRARIGVMLKTGHMRHPSPACNGKQATP